MLKKILKYLKVISIDVYVYSMVKDNLIAFPNIGYEIDTLPISKTKQKYFIVNNGVTIHQSFLFSKLHLLQLIGKKGPAIGECQTIQEYKGKSIYPFVINHIATEILNQNKFHEVFIVVNSNNSSSIKGIEKAGFKIYSKIKAKRFLLFYYNVLKQQTS